MTSVVISGFEELLEDIEDLPETVREADRLAQKAVGLFAQGVLKENWPVDTTFSREKITFERRKTAKEHFLDIGFEDDVDYAHYVEVGREPGRFPNLQAITEWLGGKKAFQRQLITNLIGKTTPLIQRQSVYDYLTKRQKQIVFIVARSIAVNGTEGVGVFEDFRERDLYEAVEIYYNTFRKHLYE